MEYRYRASYTGGIYREAEGHLAESYNFKTKTWKVSEYARDAFYEGSETYPVAPEDVLIEIGKQIERFGLSED